MRDSPETVTMSIPSLSLSASDEKTVGNSSVDHVDSGTTTWQTLSVSSIQGLDKIEVYDCDGDGVNGSASLREGGPAVGQGCYTSSQRDRSDAYVNGNIYTLFCKNAAIQITVVVQFTVERSEN